MTALKHAARRDGAGSRGTLRGSARKAFLLAGTAVALPLMASAAQAQCTPTQANQANGGGIIGDFSAAASGSVAAVQALTSVLNTTNTAFLTQTSGFIGAPSNPFPGQQGGGVWVRGIGGTVDTNTTGGYAFGNPNGVILPGNGTCRTQTTQDYGGMQIGADISRLNVNGANVHMGITAGYTESTLRSRGGGTFGGEFQIPFVGVYAAVTKGGAYADGQVRWDFIEGQINDPTNAIFRQRLDAQSLSFTGNIGNQFPLADNYFIEPSVGGVYSSAKVDPLRLSGTVFQLNNPLFGVPSTVKISNFESILGRIGVRAGKNIAVGDYVLQPFVTANVFHEFGGKVRSLVSSDLGGFFTASGDPVTGNFLSQNFDTKTALRGNRIGTYGQFAVGVAGQILNTGWLGYVRGDYRVGDHVEGYGISGGLRYQFNPETVAAATPLISKGAAPSSLVPAIEGPVTWSGFSIGGSVGATWGHTRQLTALSGNFGGLQLLAPTVGRTDPHSAGIYAGGQLGADYQFGNYVVGVAGDIGFVNAKGARGCNPRLGDLYFYNCETQVDMLSMATARAGYAYERSLFYVKGGAAFADVTERLKDNTGGQPLFAVFANNFNSAAVSTDAFGWTIGGGFEYQITRNWSAKAEYMHYELENKRLNYPLTLAFNAPSTTVAQASRHSGDIVRVGVNYRFNIDAPAPVAPVIAKY
ncbi:autotransporter domain-containing protein [Methylobacterium sp. sgz302541]|uniref:autotransporter domain-containing protein n=1 Tax=unclassified Methylobacterium TaxID=2615210 RepID=UPI003D34367F